MRDAFGTDFSPYRQEGDFNRDRRKDFAVILVKETPPTKAVDLAPTHQWRHKLGVLVFNGLPDGQYGAVFAEDVEAPLACFLRLSRNRPGNLYFGVFETCEGFLIIPTKSGYRTEGLPDSE
jgi:hypothetical protein